MVPFTPCTCVCLGSNAWSHLHTVGVSIVGSNPWSCTCVCCGVKSMVLYLCLLWGQMHDPLYTLYLSLFRVKSMIPFTPALVSVLGSNAWSHLHPVLEVKSMVPFTPCIRVCCGVKTMVPFTPCTSDQIHGPIYT